MNEKIYQFMDWPRIEAVVYGEEASPKDVMSPRLTPEGVLVQGLSLIHISEPTRP